MNHQFWKKISWPFSASVELAIITDQNLVKFYKYVFIEFWNKQTVVNHKFLKSVFETSFRTHFEQVQKQEMQLRTV